MSSYSNMPRIIDISNHKIRARIINEIDRKQDGLCRHCKRDFKPTDNIISNGKHRKYYHEACAIVLSIISPHRNEIVVEDRPNYKNSELMLSAHIQSHP